MNVMKSITCMIYKNIEFFEIFILRLELIIHAFQEMQIMTETCMHIMILVLLIIIFHDILILTLGIIIQYVYNSYWSNILMEF